MFVGSAGSTPAMCPGAESAGRKVPAPLHSTSPQQKGRPRSAGEGAVRAPLGHSLGAGALQEVQPSAYATLHPLGVQPCS